MTIKIVTDSTCDLPEDLVARHGITVIPLYVHFGLDGYRDGIEISREEFYTRLPDSNPLPTTAAPSPDVFLSVYEQLAAQGAIDILSIHVSETLSATINSARLAAAQTKSANVTVIDSRQLSSGVGFQVLAAAQMASEASSVDAVLNMLESLIPRVHVFAALDTLEFLRRSGRVNGLVAGLGNALQIKPLLKMNDGEASSERTRTSRRAMDRVVALLEGVAPLEQLAIVHANAADRAQILKQQVNHLAPDSDLWTIDITPVIGTHIGPGAVGVACVSQTK